ncbi:N-acetylornithine carbamoyltransferase [Xanthovirga aplysinae]|uniref:N-acetylornithine carbamoyltransferase n=1 Tax=Xanthovirga aplysinae TaxID=2529853 RepID=UPI0012BB9ECE|nr:N-acetylornithine carbamoyltransferase [Xanthovirga aplysinae]MTI32736.1 N-acetylornithine carbamoyltransferase [Xanthovirga aplysinae]
MKKFTSVRDVPSVDALVKKALALKAQPIQPTVGQHKVLGLVFFNPSLRTRLSTQKAAFNLGMQCMVMNVGQDGWQLEMGEGTVMDGSSQEHIKDAVRVMSEYCDILGVRTFAALKKREEDYQELVLEHFLNYAKVPIISLESATRHPLQSLADLATIASFGIKRPKVAVSWAPHPKALPQAVTNSFLEWVKKMDAEVVLAHPPGYELEPSFVEGIKVVDQQEDALQGADFVYVKNWSSYRHYGKVLPVTENWMLTPKKMTLTNQGRFMHCLPIRRNVIATDEVIEQSIVYQQAKNREYAAQAVLKTMLEEIS